jgi:uroporphyrinogen-III synthase
MDNSLEGLTVVNTRPAHQAEPLCNLITQAGGTLVEFPVIEISPLENPHVLDMKLKKFREADIAIFISANAVDAAMAISDSLTPWPENIMIASVGQATALKLESYGLTANIKASGPFNSEALLLLPELENLTGKKIIIFRGKGGRELLADTLRSRGAEVEYIECYRRLIPSSDPTSLYQYWDEGRELLIVVTSNEGLRNLLVMVNNEYQQNLLSSTLVVVSERAVTLASELGFKQKPILASTVSNEAILEAIKRWQSHN